MLKSLYIVEHPNHVCTIHYFPLDEEEERLETMRRLGILWFEKLGVVDDAVRRGTGEDFAFVKRSSRPMLFFNHWLHDSNSFMSVEHTKKMLSKDSPDYSWMTSGNSGNRIFVRFDPNYYPALVFRPYMADWKIPKKVTVPLFLQETMIRPICSLSVDREDDWYSEGDWRADLGEVEAEVDQNGIIEVRLSDVSNLVRKCPRKMLLVSDQMAPKYIPRDWLESAVLDFNLPTSRKEEGKDSNLVH